MVGGYFLQPPSVIVEVRILQETLGQGKSEHSML